MNWMRQVLSAGTPWSGHAEKWKWVTVRGSELSADYKEEREGGMRGGGA